MMALLEATFVESEGQLKVNLAPQEPRGSIIYSPRSGHAPLNQPRACLAAKVGETATKSALLWVIRSTERGLGQLCAALEF